MARPAAMLISDCAVAPGRTLRLPNGGEYVKRVYVGSFDKPATPDSDQPEIYTVAQLPGTVVDPHYHAVEQWQVFVDGSGTLGRHPAFPGAIHYADRHVGYGPIVASAAGVTYFTIRAMTDPGAQFLGAPGVRERLRQAHGSARRYLYVPAERIAPDAGAAQPGVGALDAVIAPHTDGLAAWVVRAGSEAEVVTPAAAGGGGQVLLVMSGELRHGGSMLPRRSCAFIRSGDAPLRLRSTSAGATVLVLQFPRAPAAV